MDRFDCQILMATFANVYYFTFARSVGQSIATVILTSGLGVLKRVATS